uniref:Uncharacterized protein n=1 Tax=Pavo cristatus TaxID=9049 RepID=A0A8C9FMU9_PAVCR
MTLAARAIRNNIRHYFVESPAVKLCYDFVTWMTTQVAISYTVVPFVLLSVKPSFTFYSSCYFCLHIASILVLLVFPLKRTQKGNKKHERNCNKHLSIWRVFLKYLKQLQYIMEL